jgi:MFS family permease
VVGSTVQAGGGIDTKRRWLLWCVSLTQFMVLLDAGVVNLTLPAIQHDVAGKALAAQWVLNGYLVAFGGLMAFGGHAADRWGRRRCFLGGTALFVAASAACGVADSAAMLIGARVLQGVAAAMVTPAALSLLTTTFPAGTERNRAMGVWATLAALGGISGVCVGGVVADALSWRWIFLLNVPVGALAAIGFAVGTRGIPAPPSRRKVPLGSTLAAVATMTLLIWALAGITAPTRAVLETVLMVCGAAAFAVAFVTLERRAADRLVPARLWATPTFVMASVGRMLSSATQATIFLLGSYFLQRACGISMLTAGLLLLPVGLAAIATSRLVSTLVERHGPVAVYLGGAACATTGMVMFGLTALSAGPIPLAVAGMTVAGAAMPACGIAQTVIGMHHVPTAEHGTASGVLNSAFQFGAGLGVAMASAITLHAIGTAAATPGRWATAVGIGALVAVAFPALDAVNAAVSRGRGRA